MDINQRKEQFSRACVHAVATVAGLTIYKPEVDDDSIDLGVAARSGKNSIRCPRLEMQLKCTASEAPKKAAVHFSLKRKNYDDLRVDAWTPRILAVVLVPKRVEDWLEQTDDELILPATIFWLSLRGLPGNE